MGSFQDIAPQKTPAAANDIQQVINALSGRANVPLSTIVNDPIGYAYMFKNTDPGGRGVIVFAPDGTTVLFSVDATGARVSRAGLPAVPPITDIGPLAGEAADGAHVHGAGGYSSTGTTTLEALYAQATVVTGQNYVVVAGVLFVFCTLGVTITLPAAATTARPITITAVSGATTVIATAGTVIGGSTNTSTGAVMDGVVSQADSITYKSDGTSWRSLS